MVITTGAIALVLLWQSTQPMAGGTPVSEQIACAPMSLPSPPVPAIHVVGGYAHGRIMFGPGEPLVINAGTAKGVQTGQQYFVRRYIRDRFTPVTGDFIPHSVHTAGWVTIVDAKDTMAIATVTHACDGVLDGDYLEPFVSPDVRDAERLAGLCHVAREPSTHRDPEARELREERDLTQERLAASPGVRLGPAG